LRLRETLAEDVSVTVVADRGFMDTNLMEVLRDSLKFDYIIRLGGQGVRSRIVTSACLATGHATRRDPPSDSDVLAEMEVPAPVHNDIRQKASDSELGRAGLKAMMVFSPLPLNEPCKLQIEAETEDGIVPLGIPSFFLIGT
ncbi:MAG: hypothetical protein AB7U81_13985, partial [Thiohalomonadaceae bacterium]